MQISKLSAGQTGFAAYEAQAGVTTAAAALNGPAGADGVDGQLKAYRVLADRWRGAGRAERDVLAQALTESPFARKVQSTLNTFTRAAWAGADAAPPAPQAQILKAFDALSEDDRKIVAAMQPDVSGAPTFATPQSYRGRLQAELEAVQPAVPDRKADSITLSREAEARLAQVAAAQVPATPAQAHPAVTAAIAAYAKLAR